MTTPHVMTNGEIARKLEDVASEMRSLATKMLLREVYDAHRLLLETRIKQLEDARQADIAEQAATRRLVMGGLIAFASSVAVQIVVTVLIAGSGG